MLRGTCILHVVLSQDIRTMRRMRMLRGTCVPHVVLSQDIRTMRRMRMLRGNTVPVTVTISFRGGRQIVHSDGATGVTPSAMS